MIIRIVKDSKHVSFSVINKTIGFACLMRLCGQTLALRRPVCLRICLPIVWTENPLHESPDVCLTRDNSITIFEIRGRRGGADGRAIVLSRPWSRRTSGSGISSIPVVVVTGGCSPVTLLSSTVDRSRLDFLEGVISNSAWIYSPMNL